MRIKASLGSKPSCTVSHVGELPLCDGVSKEMREKSTLPRQQDLFGRPSHRSFPEYGGLDEAAAAAPVRYGLSSGMKACIRTARPRLSGVSSKREKVRLARTD
jgi:hypothetical protein